MLFSSVCTWHLPLLFFSLTVVIAVTATAANIVVVVLAVPVQLTVSLRK